MKKNPRLIPVQLQRMRNGRYRVLITEQNARRLLPKKNWRLSDDLDRISDFEQKIPWETLEMLAVLGLL